MSSCHLFDEAIWDAALGRAVSPDLADHLRTCESCRRSLRSLSAAAQGLAALRSVTSPDPRAAVWARAAKPRRQRLRALVWAGGIAICGLAAMMLLWHGLSQQRDPTPRTATTLAHVPRETLSPHRVQGGEPPHNVDAAGAEQELAKQSPRPSIARRAPGPGSTPSASPQQTRPAPTPAGVSAQVTPEIHVAETPPPADQTSVEPTTDESGGEIGAFVNRTLGMALTKTLLVAANETG